MSDITRTMGTPTSQHNQHKKLTLHDMKDDRNRKNSPDRHRESNASRSNTNKLDFSFGKNKSINFGNSMRLKK